MTLSIDIYLSPNDGDMGTQLDDHMKALGFARAKPGYEMKRVLTGDSETDHNTMVEIIKEASETVRTAADNPAGSFGASAPTRERGKPSPGKARRTKEEIAEDEAAEAAAVEAHNAEQLAMAGDKGAISETPEDRQDPNNPDEVDPPEVAAQDAADEAAETAAASTGKLTLDDVRNKLGEYVKKFGMEAAQADGPDLLARVLGAKHDPNSPKKVSDLGDDQALIARAVAGIEEMITKNPFKRIEKAAA